MSTSAALQLGGLGQVLPRELELVVLQPLLEAREHGANVFRCRGGGEKSSWYKDQAINALHNLHTSSSVAAADRIDAALAVINSDHASEWYRNQATSTLSALLG
jgi:hypothetical protein